MATVLPLALVLLFGAACLALLASPLPYLAPLVIAGLPGLALLYRRPAWGLLAMVALVPLEGLFADSGGVTASKLLGLALIGLATVQLLLRQLPPERLRSNLWPLLLGFLACYLLSLASSDSPALSLLQLRQLLVGLALFILTVLLCRDLDLLMLARLVVLSVAATCVLALVSAGPRDDGRATGLLTDPNYFALLITFALPLALLLLLRAPRRPQRLLWLLALALLLAGLARSGSRSGLLVLLLTGLLAAWHYRADLKRLAPRHFVWPLLALAISLPLAPALLSDSFKQRLEALSSLGSGANAQVDTSLARRSSYLVVGGELIRQHPLLGSGPGTFPLHFARSGYAIAFAYRPLPEELFREAHNTYLSMLSEVGLPGGLLFIGLVLLSLRNLQIARRRWLDRGDRQQAALATHLGLSCVALASFLLFLSVPSHKYLWMMFAVASYLRREADAAATGEAQP